MASLFFFFISSSWATHYREERKEKLEEDFKKGILDSPKCDKQNLGGKKLCKLVNCTGGQRNWLQVICNGGVAAYFGAIYYLETGSGEYPIDFQRNYRRSWISLAIISI